MYRAELGWFVNLGVVRFLGLVAGKSPVDFLDQLDEIVDDANIILDFTADLFDAVENRLNPLYHL